MDRLLTNLVMMQVFGLYIIDVLKNHKNDHDFNALDLWDFAHVIHA